MTMHRARTSPGNPGKPFLKPWISLETPGKALKCFVKPWKISQNFTEKMNSQNGAFCCLCNNQVVDFCIISKLHFMLETTA